MSGNSTSETAASSTAHPTRTSRTRYVVMAFLCVLSFLTYYDMGLIMGVFWLAYALLEIPGGWLGDRFGSRVTLSRIVIAWSLFTALPGSATGFLSLFTLRFLFGAGEAGAYPNMARVQAHWLPLKSRARAGGLLWLTARWGGAFAPLIFACVPADATEWSRFRGPNGSGVGQANQMPTEWTEQDFNWRIEVPGIGHSSPVIWGERLFVTSGDEETGTRHTLCIDATSGRVLWRHDVPATKDRKHLHNSFASSTPAVDQDHVYAIWAGPQESIVLALDHQGQEKWRFDLGPFKSGHGAGVSPIVYDDLVVVGNDQEGESSIVALDRRTGKVRWRIKRDTKVAYSTPCVYQPAGRSPELIFTNWEHGIMGIDPRTGSTHWEIPVFDKGHVETSIGSPIVAGDLVLGTCGWLGVAVHTVAVRPDASLSGKMIEAYRVDRSAPLTTTPLAVDGLLVLWADDGIVSCLSAATGELFWRKRVGGAYYGSPVAVGRHIYCASRDGEMVVLAASKDYRLVARNPLGEGSHSTPAIAGGRMFVRTFSHLLSLGKP